MHFFGDRTQEETMVRIVFLEFYGEGQNLVVSAALFFLALAQPHQIHQAHVIAALFATRFVDYFQHIERADIVLFEV